MVKTDMEHIIKAGRNGNKAIAVALIVLLLIMGALSLINISKSLYSTAVNEGGLGSEDAKSILGDTLTILIITSLICALAFYLEGSPKFTTAILLAAVVAICKAVMVMDFIADDWLFYVGLGVLSVAIAYTIKLLKGVGE